MRDKFHNMITKDTLIVKRTIGLIGIVIIAVSLIFASGLNIYYTNEAFATKKSSDSHEGSAGDLLLPDLRPREETTLNDYDLVKDPKTDKILLRFAAGLANYGEGKLEVVGIRDDSSNEDDGPIPAYQRIYREDGIYEQVKVGELTYHKVHHHYHFVDAIKYSLIDPDSGETITSDKASFCLADVAIADDDSENFSQTPVYNRCYHNENAKLVKMGISPGWEDVYGKDLVGQAFDVTELMEEPAKTYILELTTNPDGVLQDTNDGDPQTISIEVVIGEGVEVGVGKSRPGV